MKVAIIKNGKVDNIVECESGALAAKLIPCECVVEIEDDDPITATQTYDAVAKTFGVKPKSEAQIKTDEANDD